MPIADGRFFTEEEERARQAVCLIGPEIASTLFATLSPIGKTVKIRGLDFTVVGLQDKLGSAFGRSQDTSVYIPYTMYMRLYGQPESVSIFGRARPESGLAFDESLDTTRVALRSRFKTPPGKADPFDFLTPDSIRQFTGQILGVIAAVVVPVTAISLVVGGIVIMNIMLVSVTERTREIGVRKALGARRSDIMLQFLVESVLMSACGGAIGLALGFLLSVVLGKAFELTLRVTMPYAVLAVFVSSAVGIISGWYPASRAAKMDPVVALRAE